MRAAGLDPQARGEQVDVVGFARIAEALASAAARAARTWHSGTVTPTPLDDLPERAVRVRAPGKVNLSLRVGPRAADGYHPVSTVFQAVSLYEEVVATPADEYGLSVSGAQAEAVPTDASNLALRAARAVAERAGHRRGRPPAPGQGGARGRWHGGRLRRRGGRARGVRRAVERRPVP